jgi:hypothetical protein
MRALKLWSASVVWLLCRVRGHAIIFCYGGAPVVSHGKGNGILSDKELPRKICLV